MKKLLNSTWLAAGTLAQTALPALAVGEKEQKFTIAPSERGDFPLVEFTLPGIISAFIRVALVAAAIIFFFWLVLGGIRYITSGGDKAATEAARGQITAALIGLVIVFAAWAIARLIEVLFGINLFELEIRRIEAVPQGS